jgi:hypothetical protein
MSEGVFVYAASDIAQAVREGFFHSEKSGIIYSDRFVRVEDYAALQAKLTEAQRDAARYQHIRPMARVMSLDMGGKHTYAMAGGFLRLRGPSLDAAIDAAIGRDDKP